MKKASSLIALVVIALVLAACQPPAPLISEKYLADTSLVAGQPCEAPCFQNITPGITTFVDALSKIKANPLYKNVESTDQKDDTPASALWAGAGDNSDRCCQMVANIKTGLVESVLVRLSPRITAQQVVDKYGKPGYIQTGDYSDTESVLQLIYPDKGVIVWTVPGDKKSQLDPSDPVVAAIFIDPKLLSDLLKTATLGGWAGFGVSYEAYQTNTPIITAMPTLSGTPQ